MHAAAEQGVLGHEQHANALLGFLGNAERCDGFGHVGPLSCFARMAVLADRDKASAYLLLRHS